MPSAAKRFEFIGVDEVLLGMAAAEEQHRLAERAALGLARRALLQEAAERRQAGAGADHDHRALRIVGQAEALGRGVAHEAVHHVAGLGARQVVGAHALEGAAARARRRRAPRRR